jgi:spermidine/putrescine transport system substrate-binding protein
MNPRLTRNELLRRGAAGGALLAFPSILAACGGGGGDSGGGGGELKDVLNFANWPLYIDEEKPTTLEDFTTQTGIKVNYFEEINDNAEYFAKIQGPSHRARASTATSSCSRTTRGFRASS